MKKLDEFIKHEQRNLEQFRLWYQERNCLAPARYPLEVEVSDLAYWQRLYRNFKAGRNVAETMHEDKKVTSEWPGNLSDFLSSQQVKKTCPGITLTSNELAE